MTSLPYILFSSLNGLHFRQLDWGQYDMLHSSWQPGCNSTMRTFCVWPLLFRQRLMHVWQESRSLDLDIRIQMFTSNTLDLILVCDLPLWNDYLDMLVDMQINESCHVQRVGSSPSKSSMCEWTVPNFSHSLDSPHEFHPVSLDCALDTCLESCWVSLIFSSRASGGKLE
jgi:hypothetical protein